MVNGLRCRKRSLVKGSDRRLRGAVSGGGERSQVEGSGRRWRGAVSGGGERSQVEGSDLRSAPLHLRPHPSTSELVGFPSFGESWQFDIM